MSNTEYIISKSLRTFDEISDAVLAEEIAEYIEYVEEVEKGLPSAARQAMSLRGERAVTWARNNPTLARRLVANQLPKYFGNSPKVRNASRTIKQSNMSPDEIRSYLRGPVNKGLPSVARQAIRSGMPSAAPSALHARIATKEIGGRATGLMAGGRHTVNSASAVDRGRDVGMQGRRYLAASEAKRGYQGGLLGQGRGSRASELRAKRMQLLAARTPVGIGNGQAIRPAW